MKFTLLLLFFLIFFIQISFGSVTGYSEKLYLCDLGIMNANSANQDGVDFIQYFQNSRTLDISAGTTYSTALSAATQANPSFDRWDPNTDIDNVSINLESDYYGSEYFLEYCYTWDRNSSSDNTTYGVTFLSNLAATIPFTNFSADTVCSIKGKNEKITTVSAIDKLSTTNSLGPDFISMRCTIKLNMKENSTYIKRPHNGEAQAIDPQVTIRVNP